MTVKKHLFIKLVIGVIVSVFSIVCFGEPLRTGVSFIERAEQLEQESHRELVEDIKKMSDVDYQAYRARQFTNSFAKSNRPKMARIIVDTSFVPAQKGEAKVNGIASVNDLGLKLIEQLTSEDQSTKSKARNSKLERRVSVPLETETKTFDQIVGSFEEWELRQLIASSEVLDIDVLEDGRNPDTYVVAIHGNTGRILPEYKPKQLSDTELREGWYKELLGEFEGTDETFIQVDFSWADDFYGEDRITDEVLIGYGHKANEFLAHHSDHEMRVYVHHSAFIVVSGDRELAESFYQDQNAKFVKVGQPY